MKSIRWSAEPDGSVSLEKQKDGASHHDEEGRQGQIIAKSGDLHGTAPLTITEATKRRTVGKAATNGVILRGGRP